MRQSQIEIQQLNNNASLLKRTYYATRLDYLFKSIQFVI
jgi:hypothetical protein